ncbi:thiamine pyrophosphate-binding protein [Solihabitans fulvus]|uniref:Thiamine pyrophosphate-binding protein n=1 Tax=Solihabitans fulvus TaxID=1892852 RepID=A0A5B2WXZ3_9PSEU|nr:thiamine pyrophosphate-dependent enzyme [Solihabitans fulvus]KAA2255376.1 thiamine pyrophosphate-binding protein [Solihabitans fulvus]
MVVDLLCGWLRGLGVDELCTVPGEAFLPLLATVGEHGIRTVTTRHEGGAGFMAIASARLTGRPAVVAVNRSPGSANVAIAVDAAASDPTPLLVLVGDIPTGADRATAFQGADLAGMFGALATTITLSTRSLADQLARAAEVLLGQQPQPVVLIVPEDLWTAPTDGEPALAISPATVSAATISSATVSPAAVEIEEAEVDVAELRRELEQARRPVLIAGRLLRRSHTDRAATDALTALAEAAGLPVLVGNKQQDLLDNRHPHYAGHLHLGSPSEVRERLSRADLVVLLGEAPDEIHLAGWTGPRTHLEKQPPRAVLAALAGTDWPDPSDERRAWIREWHELSERLATPRARSFDDGVDLTHVAAELDATLPDDAIITFDAGNFSSWIHRYVHAGPRRLMLALGNGAMGFGVPAAVAAAGRCPDRTVVCVVGDGGLLMTGDELATARAGGRCPVIVVADNGGYGTIDQHARRKFPGQYCGTDLATPDLVTWARAFGVPGEHVRTPQEVPDAVRRALSAGPDGYLLHVHTSLRAGHANIEWGDDAP